MFICVVGHWVFIEQWAVHIRHEKRILSFQSWWKQDFGNSGVTKHVLLYSGASRLGFPVDSHLCNMGECSLVFILSFCKDATIFFYTPGTYFLKKIMHCRCGCLEPSVGFRSCGWERRMSACPEAGHSAASFPSENCLQQEGFWRWDLTWKQMSVPCLSNTSFPFWECRKCSVHPLLGDTVAK